MTNLRRPEVALRVAGTKLRAATLDGHKRITIREGLRDYQVGDRLMLGCHSLGWAASANVTSVTHCLLGEVPQRDLVEDGFLDARDALAGLLQFYPDINMDSPVTVVRWGQLHV